MAWNISGAGPGARPGRGAAGGGRSETLKTGL
jgi:hypothetical protein